MSPRGFGFFNLVDFQACERQSVRTSLGVGVGKKGAEATHTAGLRLVIGNGRYLCVLVGTDVEMGVWRGYLQK